MPLKYLQPTIDLIVNTPFLGINHQPNPSQKNIAWLRETEKQYNIHIPASIAEWFSLDLPWDMGEVLQTQEIQPLSETDLYDHPQTDINLWPVMAAEYLSQGFDLLCFQMTGEDDPPIYVEGQDKFIKIAEKFSEFLYIHFWDCHRYNLHKHQISTMYHPAIEFLQVPPKYFIPINKLKSRYKELSSITRLHFYNDHSSLWSYGRLVETDEFIKQIHIATETIEVMEETINYLWDGDPPAFRFRGYDFEEIEFLHKLQKKQAINVFQSFPSNEWQIESKLAFDLGASIPILSSPMVEVLTSLVNEDFLKMKPENHIRYHRMKDNNNSNDK